MERAVRTRSLQKPGAQLLITRGGDTLCGVWVNYATGTEHIHDEMGHQSSQKLAWMLAKGLMSVNLLPLRLMGLFQVTAELQLIQ